MKIKYIGTLISSFGLLSCYVLLATVDNNLDLKDLGIDSLLLNRCELLNKRTSFFLTKDEQMAKKQCSFLNNLLEKTKETGCSAESLGLGFKEAVKQFYLQNEDDQKFTSEIRKNYLTCQHTSGKKTIKQVINEIIPTEDQAAKQKEYQRLKATANKNIQQYTQNFKTKKTQQLEEEKEKQARERRKF